MKNMLRLFNEQEKIFAFKLADETNWGFAATSATLPWLEEFAKIMQLKESSSREKINRRLMFLALKNDNLGHLKDWNGYAQGKVYRIWEHSDIPENFIELNLDFVDHEEIRYINMSASLRPLFKYYVENNGGGPIHAALAEYKGKGILIAASGGTGKSTCYRRLPSKEGWTPLSDDNALLVKKNEQFMVHPMPTWSDHLWKRAFTTFNTSYFAPLSAIFFLEQAETDEVIPLSKNMATKKAYESLKQIWETFWGKMEKGAKIAMNKKIFDSAMSLITTVPCYALKATLDGRFWKEIEKVI